MVEQNVRSDLLRTYSQAAVNLYGVISQEELIDIINRQVEEKTSFRELFLSQTRKPEFTDHYCLWENYLVKGYPERARKISLLRYELNHAGQISTNEMIETMALGHSDGNGHSDGRISDKTLYIALNYQSRTDKLNGEVKETIVTQLVDLEQKQSRLEYYVSLLEKRQAEVFRLGYFDCLPWEDVAPKVGVAL